MLRDVSGGRYALQIDLLTYCFVQCQRIGDGAGDFVWTSSYLLPYHTVPYVRNYLSSATY